MALDATELRLRLGGVSTVQLSDAQAASCLAEALRAVNDRFGYPSINSTLTTVANQQAYTLPSGVGMRKENITLVTWKKGGTWDYLSPETPLRGMGEGDNPASSDFWDCGSQMFLDQAEFHAMVGYSPSEWQFNGSGLCLMPAPTTTGDKIFIEYKRDFAAASDVPEDFQEKFWLIAQASGLEKMSLSGGSVLETHEGVQVVKLAGGAPMMKLARYYRDLFMGRI